MFKIINFNEYKSKKQKSQNSSNDYDLNLIVELSKKLRRHDEFYDYMGQEMYDWIKAGNKMTDVDKNIWHCTSEEEFLETWRGNSEEEYQKWLKENGYEN